MHHLIVLGQPSPGGGLSNPILGQEQLTGSYNFTLLPEEVEECGFEPRAHTLKHTKTRSKGPEVGKYKVCVVAAESSGASGGSLCDWLNT